MTQSALGVRTKIRDGALPAFNDKKPSALLDLHPAGAKKSIPLYQNHMTPKTIHHNETTESYT
jgi:hypothetical protein